LRLRARYHTVAILEVISKPCQSTVASNDDCAEDQNYPKANRHGWKHGQRDPAPAGRKAHQPPSDTCNRQEYQQPSQYLSSRSRLLGVLSRQANAALQRVCATIDPGRSLCAGDLSSDRFEHPTLVCRTRRCTILHTAGVAGRSSYATSANRRVNLSDLCARGANSSSASGFPTRFSGTCACCESGLPTN